MLRPRKKITKREIKEDALVTAYVRVQKFIQKHNKQLNISVTIFVLIVVVGIFVIRSKKKSELTAAGNLGVAEQFYYASDYSKAIDQLTQIAETYSGTRAAGTAVFLVANSHFAKGDYIHAEKYYRIYLDDYSKSDLFSASSMAGIAACLESQNEYSEAAHLYEKAGMKYSKCFTAPFYLKDAGKCYVLEGEKEKCRKVYQYIIKKYPGSSFIQEVEFLLERL